MKRLNFYIPIPQYESIEDALKHVGERNLLKAVNKICALKFMERKAPICGFSHFALSFALRTDESMLWAIRSNWLIGKLNKIIQEDIFK